MKKASTFFSVLGALLIGGGAFAQAPVFTSSFENWDSGKPTDWQGSASNLGVDSITQVNSGTVYGSTAVQLQNRSNSHKRFSSNAVSVEEGKEYHFKYFVKGKGEIRAGLFDNDKGDNDAGYGYSSYFTLDSEDWVEVNQSVAADTTTDGAQFIFSIRNTNAANNHIQIDSVAITPASVVPVSIYDIQFTEESAGDSPLKDQKVTTGGIITAVKPNPNGGYFLQAGTGNWSGVFVYDPARSSTVAIGDSLTISGTVKEYFNTTQIEQVSNFNKVSGGNTVPAAHEGTTAVLGTEPFEGVLVKASNAEATAAPNNFKVWPANDGSGDLLVDTVLFRYTPVVGHRYNISGVITYAFGNYRLLPRNITDIEDLVGIESPTVQLNWSVYPNPADETLYLTCELEKSEAVTIQVLDITGKKIAERLLNLPAGVSTSDLSGMLSSAGVYFVNYRTLNTNSSIRVIRQ
ncbi:MAG: T9SS type A sorting domain-containing protein [Bacteroidia bacterium]|nr:T9SS type A sorting domain-containing protein [Bacteroidia bacterium]